MSPKGTRKGIKKGPPTPEGMNGPKVKRYFSQPIRFTKLSSKASSQHKTSRKHWENKQLTAKSKNTAKAQQIRHENKQIAMNCYAFI